MKEYAVQFARVQLLTIDAEFGGWQKAQAGRFADVALVDRIHQPR